MKRGTIILLVFSWTVFAAGDGVWLDVPFIRQEANGCGAASLVMIVDYWRSRGLTATQSDARDIQRQLYVPARKGIPADAMQRYLQDHEFNVFAFSGDWDDLGHHLDLGRPFIVAMKVGSDAFHYAVVAGTSDNGIALNDPSDRKLRRYSRVDFDKMWSGAGHLTLLAVPRPGP